MSGPKDLYQGYQQPSDSLADRIRALQGISDMYGQREEDLATQTAGAGTGLSLGEGLASALISILPAVLGKGLGGKYGGVYGAKGGAAAGGLFNDIITKEKENKRKDLLTLAPVLSARRQNAENQINQLTQTQLKEENDFKLQQQRAEDIKTQRARDDATDLRIAQIGAGARIDAAASRAEQKKLSPTVRGMLESQIKEANAQRLDVGAEPLPIPDLENITEADQLVIDKAIKNSNDQVGEQRRLQSVITKEFETLNKTVEPILAAGGRIRVAPDGSIHEPDQKRVDDVLTWNKGKNITNKIIDKMASSITKNGMYIETATDQGKKNAKDLYNWKAALLQEYGGNSIFKQNGITEKEIEFLDRILPSDPNKFNELIKSGGIRASIAELKNLQNLRDLLEIKSDTIYRNAGVDFPNANGEYSNNTAGLSEILRYRAQKSGNPMLVERAEAIEKGFEEYKKFQKLPPQIQQKLVYDPFTGGYKYRQVTEPQ